MGVCLGKSLYASEPSIKWGQFFMLCRVMRLIVMLRKCPVNSSNDYYAMLPVNDPLSELHSSQPLIETSS